MSPRATPEESRDAPDAVGRAVISTIRRTTTLHPIPVSASAARRFVGAAVAELDVPVDAAIAELLTSELVTNAIVHARTTIDLSVGVEDGSVVIRVGDASPNVPVLQKPAPDSPSGRGLGLVDRLATSWGIEARPDGGKVVWFAAPPGR
ncbi:MAG: ATP-binding protein [Acidimicrobiales bacterium]